MTLDLAHIGNTPVDITEFDSVRASEAGYEFELKNENGTGTGVFLTVMGRHSDTVVKWASQRVNEATREHQMAARKGKVAPTKPVEELREQNIQGAAIRVMSWRNVKQAFSQAEMTKAIRRNPHWVDQIIEESEELGNFTKKQ